MSRCRALDLAPFSIRINPICPGYISTPVFYSYAEHSGIALGQMEKDLSNQTVLKRHGKPEEIANCIVFFCSDESSYVTGTTLMADRGLVGEVAHVLRSQSTQF